MKVDVLGKEWLEIAKVKGNGGEGGGRYMVSMIWIRLTVS